eukprot:TRINITY_DN60104_c0_g1_i1.p1 TRINITY_DN60104_c0_g1~~TRINITY_DN60104_c0_g1_i1.p1  ORF type:complete len:316 (+),score=47.65 TRINITY_DN60104_c0_g1_i1:143-1090(+)
MSVLARQISISRNALISLAACLLLTWLLDVCSRFAFLGAQRGAAVHGPYSTIAASALRALTAPAVLDMGEGKHVEEWYGAQMDAEPPSDDDELMNYGLHTDPLHPAAVEHPQAHMANMYAMLADRSPLTSKRVLEVGSGRGGGAAVLSRWHQPAQYVGLDLVATQVSSSNRRLASFGSSPLVFVQGDAQDIPFPNSSFDVVINVESSHNYPNFMKFLKEVRRVLAKGGVLLIEDFRNDDADMNAMMAQLKDVFGEDGVTATNISSNVVASMEMRREYIEERIAECEKFSSRDYCYWYWWGGGTLPTFVFTCQLVE